MVLDEEPGAAISLDLYYDYSTLTTEYTRENASESANSFRIRTSAKSLRKSL